jgi:hypothetical protein
MRIIGPQKRGLFTALIGVHQNPIGMIVRRNIRKSWQIFIGRLCAAILADLYWTIVRRNLGRSLLDDCAPQSWQIFSSKGQANNLFSFSASCSV